MKRVKSMPDTTKVASRQFSKHRQLHGPSEDDNDTGATSARLPGKLLLAMLVPFLPVYIYALYNLFTGAVLLVYLLALFLYFLVVGAFVVAEISICPPWYVHSSPKHGLSKHGLPDYWQGIVQDPEKEFGFKYDSVEFKNEADMTLRGWWVPGEKKKRRERGGKKKKSFFFFFFFFFFYFFFFFFFFFFLNFVFSKELVKEVTLL